MSAALRGVPWGTADFGKFRHCQFQIGSRCGLKRAVAVMSARTGKVKMDTLNTIGMLAALFLVFVLAGGAKAAFAEPLQVPIAVFQH